MRKVLQKICHRHKWRRIVWREAYDKNVYMVSTSYLYACEICNKQKWVLEGEPSQKVDLFSCID